MTKSLKTSFLILVSGLALSGTAALTSGQPLLTGNLATGVNNNVNLSLLGTEDWAIWGYSAGGTSTSLIPDVTMAGGSGISGLTYLDPHAQPLRGLGQYSINYQFAWNNGSIVTSATGARGGLQVNTGTGPGLGVNEGFSFTVPAGPAEQVLYVFVDEHEGIGQLSATLSDGSAAPYINSGIPVANNSPGEYTINFAAASGGQTLTVTWKETSASATFDNPGIYAVALSPVATPEPSTLALSALGGLGALLRFRKRK